ncbi:BlaI/MecI/CopY family transcriptional regulator [Streptomyces griseorubiginosus]|uniref:BlaI/MecI/CopY family transcriptional regulator n=1 Tax=Streptomyces griseorubiginosus TaxID=67304 RepID=UPI001140121F|nr:BlaI/MecI/CopY family transcriptional regulator [Streptomyces griseorubiginosus]
MSDTVAAKNGVTTQYLARVADDLEQNLKEQERLGTEIAVLQSQLAELEADRTVLLNLQEALGAAPAPATSAPGAAEPESAPAAPEPESAPAATVVDKKDTAAPAKKARAKKPSAAPVRKPRKAKTAAAKPAEPRQPSLVTLARDFLTSQTEPRSAAEIAEALAQEHPDRGIKKTVVRTTLEGLVAKNHAQRSKQGSSVFYTAPDPAEPSADSSTASE